MKIRNLSYDTKNLWAQNFTAIPAVRFCARHIQLSANLTPSPQLLVPEPAAPR